METNEETQGEFQQTDFFFFSTRMKMDAYRNFTRSETAQRGNAFSISRGIFDISAHFFSSY